MQQLIIGGSTGDFYRIESKRNTDKLMEKYFISPAASALEIMVIDESFLDCKISKEILEKNFSFCSLHTPEAAYQNDENTHNILNKIKQICDRLPIKNIIIHPNEVRDRSVFKEYHLPFSIENMDERKTCCQGVKDIAKILEQNPNIQFTLDLQHAFVNDPTMQLAKDLHDAFKDRLVAYHISGYDKEFLHYPLFKTHQKEIIHAVQRPDLPLIIESTFDKINELEKEIQYIQENIRF